MTEKPLLKLLPPDGTPFIETQIDVQGKRFLIHARGEIAKTLGGGEQDTPVELKGVLEKEEWTTKRNHKRERVLIQAQSVSVL